MTQGVYTGMAPCCEGKGLIHFEVVLLMSRLLGSESHFLAFDLFSLALSRHRVVPLYTQVVAQRLTESWSAHKQRVRPGD